MLPVNIYLSTPDCQPGSVPVVFLNFYDANMKYQVADKA